MITDCWRCGGPLPADRLPGDMPLCDTCLVICYADEPELTPPSREASEALERSKLRRWNKAMAEYNIAKPQRVPTEEI